MSKIQVRRGTSSQWTTANTLLSSGEIGFETDTNKFKIGDGTLLWDALEYFINLEDIELLDYLTTSSASTTYLTQASFSSASPNFATDAELASAIVTASAAAVAYADGLTTADVTENTNLYFTNERAVNAGSATYILQASQQEIINSASAAAVTYLVDSAPETLDTLNELAAALGDDANFASTITTALGNKLDASSASTTYLTQASASTTYQPIVENISDTEIGYLNNASANIQTQLNTKSPLDSPTFTGTVVLPSTVNGPSTSTSVNLLFPTQGGHITLGGSQTTGNLTLGGGSTRTTGVIGIGTGATTTGTKTINIGTGSTGGTTAITIGSSSGATSNLTLNGNISLPSTTSIGDLSSTELGYLNGVTSDIQTQIDSKLSASSASTTYLTQSSASTTYATKTELENIDALPSQTGNSGKYLTTDGTNPSWETVSGGTTSSSDIIKSALFFGGR